MLREKLKKFQADFNHELELFFDTQIGKATGIDPHIVDMMQNLRAFAMRGGKRIRPALLYYSYQCYSDQHLDQVLKASVACELMQTGALIHDDIIDQDDQRRGGPTLHNIYTRGEDTHFGNSIALLAGTISGYLGLQALSDCGFDKTKIIPAIDFYANAMLNVHYGEALDVFAERDPMISEDQIQNIHYLKTACYTTIAPFEIGLSLAQSPVDHFDFFRGIGKDLGIAFQIQDDLLGLFGTEAKTGKSNTNDLLKRKKTLLVVKALELGSEEQREQLQTILQNDRIQSTEVQQVCDILEQSGSLQYSRDLAATYINRAKEQLRKLKLKPEGTEFICALADFIANREY